LTFNISSNSQSSSILQMGTHADTYPDVKVTEKLAVKDQKDYFA
jgi:hypothetical protein